MGKLDEYAWTTRGHEEEPEGTKHTDLRITEKPDGIYEVKTLIEPSHNSQFDNIEDLVASFESMLHQQRGKAISR